MQGLTFSLNKNWKKQKQKSPAITAFCWFVVVSDFEPETRRPGLAGALPVVGEVVLLWGGSLV